MSLSHDLQEWEEKIAALLAETQTLRERAEEIEKQNFLLQEQLAAGGGKKSGLKELAQLYDEGYHICHAYFAQSRSEECLFCLSFLHREGIPQKHEE
ncbi:MAG: initiation control protein YabA [Bacillota bacterium]|jgi:regulator of replication initiation timing